MVVPASESSHSAVSLGTISLDSFFFPSLESFCLDILALCSHCGIWGKAAIDRPITPSDKCGPQGTQL